MEPRMILYVCIAHVFLCVIGIIVCFLVHKQSIKFYFSAFQITLAMLSFYSGAIMFYADLTMIRFIAVAATVGVFNVFATAWFSNVFIKPVEKIDETLKSLSAGDFTVKLDGDFKREFSIIFEQMNIMISNISILISSIKRSSMGNFKTASNLSDLAVNMSKEAEYTLNKTNSVTASSEEMSVNMTSVVKTIEMSSQNISMVAAALEENTATINDIANNSEKARVITNQTVTLAKNTSMDVQKLDEAAVDINKVTETITEISEQTNLLALNASIEAARAGEAGRGFAIVAGEIKDLAGQTAGAINDIKERVKLVQDTIKSTVSNIEKITRVITDSHDIVTGIASSVDEQSTAARETAGNVTQASQGLKAISENSSQGLTVTQTISKDISEANQNVSKITESSSHIKTSAEKLSAFAKDLEDGISKFIILDKT